MELGLRWNKKGGGRTGRGIRERTTLKGRRVIR